jgi:hypothetical protein
LRPLGPVPPVRRHQFHTMAPEFGIQSVRFVGIGAMRRAGS